MSVLIVLSCDGPPRHPAKCGAQFPVGASSLAEAREVAAKAEGWTSSGNWDGCPGHSAAVTLDRTGR